MTITEKIRTGAHFDASLRRDGLALLMEKVRLGPHLVKEYNPITFI